MGRGLCLVRGLCVGLPRGRRARLANILYIATAGSGAVGLVGRIRIAATDQPKNDHESGKREEREMMWSHVSALHSPAGCRTVQLAHPGADG